MKTLKSGGQNHQRALLILSTWLWVVFSPSSDAATKARLLFADQVLGSFTNGQERVAVIVNLTRPAQALQATDWNSPQSLQKLHAANLVAEDGVLNTLAADEHRVRFKFDNQAGFSCEVTEKALQKLLDNPNVETIEPVHVLEVHLAQGIPLMNALTSRSAYNGTNMAIAICDTGIDYNHPRLGGGGFPNSKVLGGYDFGDWDADPIPNGQAHGTACAGIAAGDLGTVGDYIGGVAPGAKLYACKISYGTTGLASNDSMVAAWDWCVTHKNYNPAYPIMVISTSFGGGRNFSACDGDVPAMTTAASNAVAAGITVLASSGNDGYCDSIAWPACISHVIAVGAVYDANFGIYQPCISINSCAPKAHDNFGGCSNTAGWYATDNTSADRVTSYSNVADFLAVFAPGNQCYTLDIVGSSGESTGDYNDHFGGTSAACPYAAGAVACLQQAAKAITGSYLTPAAARSALTNSGDLVTDTKVAITKPRINLGRAINALPSNLTVTSPNGGGVYQRGHNLYVNWNWSGNIGQYVNIELWKGGAFNTSIANNTFNAGFYSWPIPSGQTLGTDYRVRVASTSTSASDSSDADFTITNSIPTPSKIAISTTNDLKAISEGWGSTYPVDGYYVLMNDINARDSRNWNGGLGFKPIGNGYSDWFRGVFDGQGHMITNLAIVRTSESYVGFFRGTVNNAVIKNLTINYRDCEGKGHVGGIVGQNAGTIQNCHVSVNQSSGWILTTNGPYVGGIAGENYGTILNCSVNGSSEIRAEGSDNAGGIAGLNGAGGIVRWCWVENSAIISAYTSGGKDPYYIGGIVGQNYGGHVLECDSRADYITGRYYIGGLVGDNDGGGEIGNCLFRSGIASGGWIVGGLVGANTAGNVRQCYASCGIEGNTEKGSLAGDNFSLVQDSYWNTNVSSFSAVGNNGGTVSNCFGKSTVQLQQSTTFAGWDFTNVWSIAEGVDFPVLRGVGNALDAPTGLTASSGLADGVHVTWNAVAGAGFYQVSRSDVTNGTAQTLSTNWLAGLSFVDTNAAPNTTFYYWVTGASTTDGGRQSATAGPVAGSRTPPPVAVPQNVTASDGVPSHVVIDWSPVAGANYYQVYRSDTLGGAKTTLSAWQTATSYLDATGIAGASYYYWVKAALDGSGGSASDYSAPDTGYFVVADSDGDGIPDWWTQQYFGHSTGQAGDKSRAQDDADGTGQNNLFKYTAGLDPTNPASIFLLKIAPVLNQPSQRNLLYNPVMTGRTYTPQFSTNLTLGNWSPLTGYVGPATNGNQVTITDTNAVQPQKFYRIGISLP